MERRREEEEKRKGKGRKERREEEGKQIALRGWRRVGISMFPVITDLDVIQTHSPGWIENTMVKK